MPRGFGGIIVNTNWAGAHMNAVKGLMAAYAKSLDWFLDPSNRDEAIAILRKAGNLDEQEVVQAYAFTRKIPFFETTGKLSHAQFDSLMKVLVEMGELKAPIPLERLGLPGVSVIAN